MNIENSDKHGARGKTLAELWLMRYLVESKLDIKNPKDIDPFAFVLWLQSRLEPSPGQKKNIATAIRKHVGLKLPPIFGQSREVLEVIMPSMESFNSTMIILRTFSDEKNIDADIGNIRRLAFNAFFLTCITGLSIAELMRSEISNKQEIDHGRFETGKEKYEITISIGPSCSLKASNTLPKKIKLINFSVSDIEVFEPILASLREAGSSAEYKQVISKIQYIIAKHNKAKGYNLRQLRKMYPAILGYIKTDS